MIDKRLVMWSGEQKAKSAILVLPGRGQTGPELARAWINTVDLPDTMYIAVTPASRQWYPLPISSHDQRDAVQGLELARYAIEEVLERIEEEFSIPRAKTALVGFSAGGVMCNYVASRSLRELAGIVCHAGAILEPSTLPHCKFSDMPIILNHCEDDSVFSWEERYLPMKEAFEEKGYNLWEMTAAYGGHNIDLAEIQYSATVLCRRLGYSQEFFEELSKNFGFDEEEMTN